MTGIGKVPGLVLVVLLALLVPLATGCSDAAPADTSTTATAPPPTEAETTTTIPETTTTEGSDPQVIRIGAPLPLTGIYAQDGDDMQTGLELAVADLNEAGGLLGRPVELRVFDIEDMSADVLAASKSYLVDQLKVDVIIEGYGGYGPDFEAYGAGSDVPFIHASGSVAAAELVSDDPGTYNNMFQVAPVEAEYGRRALQGVTQFEDRYVYPNKKLALVYGDEDWDEKYVAGAAAEAQKAGWQIVVEEQVPYDIPDWGPVLAKIRAERPAAIICSFLSVDGMASFVSQFMQAPTPSLLDISYLLTLREAQEALGDRLEGVMGYVSAYLPPGGDNDAWRDRYEKMWGSDVPLTNPPSAYDSVMLWAEAVRAVGDETKYSQIADYIRTHPYKGLLGTYDFGNPGLTVESGPRLPIAYAQYAGNGKLRFHGTDDFTLPAYLQPAWPAKGETTTTAGS